MKKIRIIDNRTLVEEERLGYGSEYLFGHETTIEDPEVRRRIAHMAVAEVMG